MVVTITNLVEDFVLEEEHYENFDLICKVDTNYQTVVDNAFVGYYYCSMHEKQDSCINVAIHENLP